MKFINIFSDSFPSDPIALSFWVAHNLQLGASVRLLLFKLDSALHRLQIELKYLEKVCLYYNKYDKYISNILKHISVWYFVLQSLSN